MLRNTPIPKGKVRFIVTSAGANAETGKTVFCTRWTDQYGKVKEKFYIDHLDKHIKFWEDGGWTIEVVTTDTDTRG